jgi:transposase-like protein
MSTKKAIRGKRYSAEEKTKIIAFVNEHNAKNKRGGQLTAAKKFGISQLTIATWLKKSGGKSTGKAAAKGAKKTTAKSTSKAVTTKGSMEKKLNSLLSLGKEMEKLERDLKAKRAQFDSIKASL